MAQNDRIEVQVDEGRNRDGQDRYASLKTNGGTTTKGKNTTLNTQRMVCQELPGLVKNRKAACGSQTPFRN